jgi:REP element-mobilizing transposase RayT
LRGSSRFRRKFGGEGGKGTLWQTSFYDHGIRGSQDFEATVVYILDNPVKAELVEDWESYPHFAGTLIEAKHAQDPP